MGSAPKTAFQKIAFFNQLIGNDNAATTAGLAAQFACVEEEFKELQAGLVHYCQGVESINKGDYTAEEVFGVGGFQEGIRELRDGIADVLVTVYGLAHRAGIDADHDLECVNKSNMSKFLTTENQDAESMEITLRLGIGTLTHETAPGIFAVTSERDATGKDGKFYPKGKLLKPSTYKEPDFNQNFTPEILINQDSQVYINNQITNNALVDELKVKQ